MSELTSWSTYEWSAFTVTEQDDPYVPGVTWYDTSREAALGANEVLQTGHTYQVRIRLKAKEYASFAPNESLKAYINGKPAEPLSNDRASVTIQYTFPTLKEPDQVIDNVDAGFDFASFAIGTSLSRSSASTEDARISDIETLWRRDGAFIEDDSAKVMVGNWGFRLTLMAADGYIFNQNSQVTIDEKPIKASYVSEDGKTAQFLSSEDVYTAKCTHSYSDSYSYDSRAHWKVCTECGEKTEATEHTLIKGTNSAGKTTYTCSVCGYQRIDEHEIDGYLFNDVEGGVEIYGYRGEETTLVVPDTLGDKSVVSIAAYTFATADNKTSLVDITLPDTVASIGRAAFNGCSSLTDINIPDGVTRIEKETFLGCTNLGDIEIPDSITYIGEAAFQSCGLDTIDLPCGLKFIGNSAFGSCNNLTKVIVPDYVTTLDNNAFSSCKGLTEAILGDHVTTLSQSVFDGCTALESLTLPAGLTTIQMYNLDKKSQLQTIYFRGTREQWNSIDIKHYNEYDPDQVTITYDYDEKPVYDRHDYEVKEQVDADCTHEGYKLMVCKHCGDSYQETIPKLEHTWDTGHITKMPTTEEEGVTTYTCTVCTETREEPIAKLPPEEPQPEYECNPTNENTEAEFTKYNGTAKDYEIPATDNELPITVIGSGAFVSNDTLESVTIPMGVTTIENSAFMNCTNLRSVTIPNTVTSIGFHAFKNCSKLTSITLPDSLDYLDSSAFDQSGLYLDEANWENDILYISNYLVSSKKDISGEVLIKTGTIGIADGSFCSRDKITKAVIPDSVKNINTSAFLGCKKLETADLGKGVVNIGTSAFEDCALKEVTLPKSVKTISELAFGYIITVQEGAEEDTKIDGFAIHGYKNTAAEAYAKENAFTFTDLEAPPQESKDPDVSADPKASKEPNVSADPKTSKEPNVSADPKASKDPTVSTDPKASKNPNASSQPGQPSDPNASSQPGGTTVPGNTSIPSGTQAPTGTAAPNKTAAPSTTAAPNNTAKPTTSPESSDAEKAANPIKVKIKAVSLKAAALKKKNAKLKAITIKDAKGKVSCQLVKKGSTASLYKNAKLNGKGILTIKKGTYKTGAYKLKVKIQAKGNQKYESKAVSKNILIVIA